MANPRAVVTVWGLIMFRRLLLAAGVVVAVTTLVSTSEAASTCKSTTTTTANGKCATGQTKAPAKTKQAGKTQTKSTKPRASTGKGRNDYSAAEREKMMARAREICSREFGKPSRVYRVDYAKGRVWCTPASY